MRERDPLRRYRYLITALAVIGYVLMVTIGIIIFASYRVNGAGLTMTVEPSPYTDTNPQRTVDTTVIQKSNVNPQGN